MLLDAGGSLELVQAAVLGLAQGNALLAQVAVPFRRGHLREKKQGCGKFQMHEFPITTEILPADAADRIPYARVSIASAKTTGEIKKHFTYRGEVEAAQVHLGVAAIAENHFILLRLTLLV